jgi:hypothetical protein
VINDTETPENNGVWELAAGAAAWALIPDTFDYVDETHNRVFSVETKAELPDPVTLNPGVNYMCRVTDDKVEDEDGKVTSRPENNGVWHLKAGAAAWVLPPPQPWQGETMLVVIKIHVELEKIANMPVQFLAAEYITAVAGVYDRDEKALVYTRNGLVITAPREANYAVITGYTNNRLGEIVVQLISTIGGVAYSNTFWDTAETDAYKNSSPRLNIAIKSGTVRSAVNEVLKSDMVFLIQKNNARFTLRTWGKEYAAHNVETWLLTQQPSKNWKDAQKYWFSSCVVKYAKNDRMGEFGNQIFLNDNENGVKEKYNRMKTSEFETNLTAAADARSLAGRLSERFNFLKETISIGIGKDTSGINPLDAILITVAENERVYSHTKRWIVKEIDPAQDKMTLEEA